MKTPRYLLLISIICLSFLLVKCGKDGGVGPAGAGGAKGDPGTANVIYSAWQNTTPWVASTTSTGSGKKTFYFDIAATGVTQAVIDNGTVLVYAKFVGDPDGAGAKLLPSIYYNVGFADIQYRFQQSISVGKIRIICDVLPSGSPAGTNQVRYVIIPGGVSTTAVAHTNFSNYAETKQALHLVD